MKGGQALIIKDWKKDIFTIPNILSLFRLALIPLYASLYLSARDNMDYYLAAAILAVSCLTDLIDGQIARRFNMVSTLGKILDPFADKLTQATMVVCLAIRHSVLWFLMALLVVKELFQLIAGLLRMKKGKMLKGAQISGKISTTVLFISLIVLVMFPSIPGTAINWICLVDIAVLLVALVDYIIVYSRKDNKFQVLNSEEK